MKVKNMENRVDKVFSFFRLNNFVFNCLVDESRQKKGIIPFVGEAMSKCVFGTRKDFIQDTLSRLETNAARTFESIDVGGTANYLDVLDKLIQKYGKTLIDDRLLKFYSDDLIDEYYIRNQPISLIPYIYDGNCITANMDHIIDSAFNISKIQPDIIHPYERKKIISRIRNSTGRNVILKLHGDFYTDSKQRILTKDEYNNHYSTGSDFYLSLVQWIQNNTILYIGVDIHKDDYLFALMKELSSSGLHHYAIIGCKNDEYEKNRLYQQLDKINILPIMYDEDHPEDLEMIVHKLLVDMGNATPFEIGELDYKYSQQDIIGRSNEVRQLKMFLDKEFKIELENRKKCDFQWTIVYGNGYTGKSKLVYEVARLYAYDWKWFIINPQEIKAFLNRERLIQDCRSQRLNRKILVIFDDFDWYKGDLEAIFKSKALLNSNNIKVRFIFVFSDVRKSSIYKKLHSSNHDSFWELMGKTLDDKLIAINQLSENDIVHLCKEYLYYCSTRLGYQSKETLELDYSQIESELKSYISALVTKKEPTVIYRSQLKAVSLINQLNGNPYLKEADIAEKIFRLTISAAHLEQQSTEDFDYLGYYDFMRKRCDDAEQFLKEYKKNEEIMEETVDNARMSENDMVALKLKHMDWDNIQLQDRVDEGTKDE